MINRVEDYNSYIAGKDKNFSNEHYFISDLKYTDIIVKGNPPQIQDVDDAKCEIEYEAIVARNKRGIDGIDFRIHKIELELSVDDYPNDKKTFEFEISEKTCEWSTSPAKNTGACIFKANFSLSKE